MNCSLTNLFLSFLIFVSSSSSASLHRSHMPCPLAWVDGDHEDNSIPDNVVTYSASDIVVRVKVQDDWVAGRLSTEDNTVSSVSSSKVDIDAQTTELSTYQILTNPNSCLIEWIHLDDVELCTEEVFPSLAFVQDTSKQLGIGKSYFADESLTDFQLVGGSFNTSTCELTVSFHNHLAATNQFQALISFYPPLTLTLHTFSFADVPSTNSKLVQIGCSKFQVNSNDDKMEIQETINHYGEYMEQVEIHEAQEFIGVAQVNLLMSMPYGGSLINSSNLVEGKDIKTLIQVQRKRTESLQKKLTIAYSSETRGNIGKVCSYFEIINSSVGIDFEASGTFHLEGIMKSNTGNVVDILKASGRIIKDIYTLSNDGASVTVPMKGKITGEFVFGTISITD